LVFVLSATLGVAEPIFLALRLFLLARNPMVCIWVLVVCNSTITTETSLLDFTNLKIERERGRGGEGEKRDFHHGCCARQRMASNPQAGHRVPLFPKTSSVTLQGRVALDTWQLTIFFDDFDYLKLKAVTAKQLQPIIKAAPPKGAIAPIHLILARLNVYKLPENSTTPAMKAIPAATRVGGGAS